MKTPCIAACKNNEGICSGCHRTIAEIQNWRHMTDEEREHIMNKLSQKVNTHSCPKCGEPAHCDISAGKSSCWCFEIERRDTSSEPKESTCYCRTCLSELPTR
ncbi:cysteine-rich CWC family protein [Vibrio mexicanus]|uniref:cysteine-rich CWC family protein n=1 Tax=Vibrio mexicanus TaxID=1004326 RepID=UPI00063C9F3E|nr:cysteine-rich CWC family protein [Vibrio mexicanus]